jgi:protein TonB
VSEQLPEKPVNADGGTPPDNSDVQLNFLVPSSIELPWYKGIVQGIKELINPPKLPPLEITSKPMQFGAPGEDTDVHLQHFLVPETIELPWYKGAFQGIKELINPPKLPPLEVTSKPVDLPSLKGLYGGHETTAGLSSVVVHVAVVALLLFVGSLKPVQKAVKEFVPIFAPDLKPLQPKPKPEQSKGGGGSPQKTEVTKGELPKVAPKSFVPPIRTVEDPKLALTPTIIAPDLPNINAPNYGDPLGRLGIPSAGNGIGTGIGSGRGPGVGPGSGGGFGGGAYKIGGGVSAPVPVFRPEPEYSEEARKAKWQGAVLLQLVVDENGVPQEIKVVRSLGLGLDQKAIEAVQKWRFKPGLKDGKPVPVSANIEVNFRLL